MSTFNRFEDIAAWQLARELSKEIFFETKRDLFSKDSRLCSQINDAGGSVMSNIAEGYGRGGRLEFIQVLGFASGSCTEVESQLYQALDRNYISTDRFDYFRQKAKTVERKISNLISYLNRTDIKGSRYKGRI